VLLSDNARGTSGVSCRIWRLQRSPLSRISHEVRWGRRRVGWGRSWRASGGRAASYWLWVAARPDQFTTGRSPSTAAVTRHRTRLRCGRRIPSRQRCGVRKVAWIRVHLPRPAPARHAPPNLRVLSLVARAVGARIDFERSAIIDRAVPDKDDDDAELRVGKPCGEPLRVTSLGRTFRERRRGRATAQTPLLHAMNSTQRRKKRCVASDRLRDNEFARHTTCFLASAVARTRRSAMFQPEGFQCWRPSGPVDADPLTAADAAISLATARDGPDGTPTPQGVRVRSAGGNNNLPFRRDNRVIAAQCASPGFSYVLVRPGHCTDAGLIAYVVHRLLGDDGRTVRAPGHSLKTPEARSRAGYQADRARLQ